LKGSKNIETEETRLTDRLVANVETVFKGKRDVIELAVTSLLAGGHILLEDAPGVGKTTLASALARSIGASFKRVQFTNDLLPADILGVNIFNTSSREFDFKAGPVFTNVLLADEINRTTPRSQSALLEAMEEGRVSIDGHTHQLPMPFIVMATQNPLEYHGTYPLPESQLDRFLMRLTIGHPRPDVEREILLNRTSVDPLASIEAVLDIEELIKLQAEVDKVAIDESIVDHIIAVVETTRRSPALRSGISTRGALAMVRACRAHALVNGRNYCLPDDALRLYKPVLAHRLNLSGVGGQLGNNRLEAEALLEELTMAIEVPV